MLAVAVGESLHELHVLRVHLLTMHHHNHRRRKAVSAQRSNNLLFLIEFSQKCDGKRPVCTQCITGNRADQCSYGSQSLTHTEALQQDIENLQAQLSQLEKERNTSTPSSFTALSLSSASSTDSIVPMNALHTAGVWPSTALPHPQAPLESEFVEPLYVMFDHYLNDN